MAEMVVSASKGVIGPLVAKLTDLIVDKGDKYGANLMGVSKNIVFLRDELSSMNALLHTLQDTNELSLQVKDWRDQVREAAYDIEDCIDDFINKVGSAAANAQAGAGLINKLKQYIQTLRAHLEATMKIKELKTRLHEINDRRKRYKLEDSTSGITLVDVDHRLSALYKESTTLVGIESQKKKLGRWIMDGGQQLKVVSIVGFGGLGKTTLANEVYREVKGHFDCMAFVSFSQKPDIIRLLNNVLYQLGQDPSSHACEPRDHINRLRDSGSLMFV